MAKCTEDLINLLNVMADPSQPHVPKDGFGKAERRNWKDISIATLDPHRWHLPSEVQKPQPGALEQIVSLLSPDMVNADDAPQNSRDVGCIR